MKRIFLPGALLLVVVAAMSCTAPAPANNTNQAANANTATPTPTPSSAELIEKDKQVYEAIKRKDWDAFAAFLADDQLYVTTDGVHDKAATLESVKKLDLTEISFSDFKTLNVDSNLTIVTFTSRAKATYDGKPTPDGPMRESSAWINRGGKWLAVYHQDTKVETPPAPATTPGGATPAANTNTATTPASSPSPAASAAAAATATDVEKQIWDALRRKDWDGFAAHLASDAVEVEPDGVFDKAGTVNAVKQFDFTGVTQSEFKELKLDADAALVTYVVKGPRPPFDGKGMRHSTILANRGGRWLAVFHQGTKVTK